MKKGLHKPLGNTISTDDYPGDGIGSKKEGVYTGDTGREDFKPDSIAGATGTCVDHGLVATYAGGTHLSCDNCYTDFASMLF